MHTFLIISFEFKFQLFLRDPRFRVDSHAFHRVRSELHPARRLCFDVYKGITYCRHGR